MVALAMANSPGESATSVCLLVERPGIDSWIVDGGRFGFRDRGVCPGGPADRFAHDLANSLLGNDPTAATIEFSLIGPTITLNGGPVIAALTGAVDQGQLDDRALPTERTFRWQPGQTLRLSGMSQGARSYLAVGGGIQSPVLLGSRQGLVPLAAHQKLPLSPRPCPLRRPSETVWHIDHRPIRVLPGPESDDFDFGEFCRSSWHCSSLVNRMGCRLEGNPLERKHTRELLSEPVLPGVIQINHAGLPMILGVQCQTIGGYPRIACVIRADLDRIGQLRPGTPVTFERVDQLQAQRAWQEKKDAELTWLHRLRASPTS